VQVKKPWTIPARTTKLGRRVMKKSALDVRVAEQLGCSRRRAQALILAGKVRVGTTASRVRRALWHPERPSQVEDEERFVGRGAKQTRKKRSTISDWHVEGLRCLDVGRVHRRLHRFSFAARCCERPSAVDVGYGQLAWKLRIDPRVIVHERCNFRHADVAALGAPFAFACVDVSFISIAKLGANLAAALEIGGRLVALIKPHLKSARRGRKGGVVAIRPATRAPSNR